VSKKQMQLAIEDLTNQVDVLRDYVKETRESLEITDDILHSVCLKIDEIVYGYRDIDDWDIEGVPNFFEGGSLEQGDETAEEEKRLLLYTLKNRIHGLVTDTTMDNLTPTTQVHVEWYNAGIMDTLDVIQEALDKLPL